MEILKFCLKFLNFLGIFKKSCHFELSLESEKSIRILKYALNLWILRCAQYDKLVWQIHKRKKKSKKKERYREKRKERKENEKMKK